MRRYFFDIHDGHTLILDETGVDCETEQHVRREAITVLPEIAKDQLPNGAEVCFWVKVRDESGIYVFEASLELKSGWLSS